MTRQELERLLLIHGESAFGFCPHFTGSKGSGEELFQETILRMLQVKERIRADEELQAHPEFLAETQWREEENAEPARQDGAFDFVKELYDSTAELYGEPSTYEEHSQKRSKALEKGGDAACNMTLREE